MSEPDPAMTGQRTQIARIVTGYLDQHDQGRTILPGLCVGLAKTPISPTSYLFEPSLCVSASGFKRVTLGEATYTYGEDTFLLTAVGLPTIIEVPDASETKPYVAIQLILDLDLARQVIGDLDALGLAVDEERPGIATGPVTNELLDAVVRFVSLLERPREIPMMHQAIHREILYRILSGPAGGRLREMVKVGSQVNRTGRAVAWLRRNLTRPFRMEELASEAGMAVSTLHHHFKVLTTMSPLQFQKYLRLHEARRLMLSEETDAATTAFRVGYESVTQFNREYRRLFGAPPVRDVKALRANSGYLEKAAQQMSPAIAI